MASSGEVEAFNFAERRAILATPPTTASATGAWILATLTIKPPAARALVREDAEANKLLARAKEIDMALASSDTAMSTTTLTLAASIITVTFEADTPASAATTKAINDFSASS